MPPHPSFIPPRMPVTPGLAQEHLPNNMATLPVTEDYYSVLEVEYGADLETIKASFRRLAKVLHPDKNINDSARATARFQLVRPFR